MCVCVYKETFWYKDPQKGRPKKNERKTNDIRDVWPTSRWRQQTSCAPLKSTPYAVYICILWTHPGWENYVCIGWSYPNKFRATLLIIYVPRVYTKYVVCSCAIQHGTLNKQNNMNLCVSRGLYFSNALYYALYCIPMAAVFSLNFIIFFFFYRSASFRAPKHLCRPISVVRRGK